MSTEGQLCQLMCDLSFFPVNFSKGQRAVTDRGAVLEQKHHGAAPLWARNVPGEEELHRETCRQTQIWAKDGKNMNSHTLPYIPCTRSVQRPCSNHSSNMIACPCFLCPIYEEVTVREKALYPKFVYTLISAESPLTVRTWGGGRGNLPEIDVHTIAGYN